MEIHSRDLNICDKCKAPCVGDLKKADDLERSGLTIYVHKEEKGIQKNTSFTSKNSNIVLYNTEEKELKECNYMSGLCQYKRKCTKCRTILQRVRSLLDEITAIRKNEGRGVCVHCNRPNPQRKCERCDYIVNKFLSDKVKQYEQRHQRFTVWLYKVRRLLQAIVGGENICKHRLYQASASTDELERLLQELNSPLPVREPVIGSFPSIISPSLTVLESLSESKEILEDLLSKIKCESLTRRYVSDDSLYVSYSNTKSCDCKYLMERKLTKNIEDLHDETMEGTKENQKEKSLVKCPEVGSKSSDKSKIGNRKEKNILKNKPSKEIHKDKSVKEKEKAEKEKVEKEKAEKEKAEKDKAEKEKAEKVEKEKAEKAKSDKPEKEKEKPVKGKETSENAKEKPEKGEEKLEKGKGKLEKPEKGKEKPEKEKETPEKPGKGKEKPGKGKEKPGDGKEKPEYGKGKAEHENGILGHLKDHRKENKEKTKTKVKEKEADICKAERLPRNMRPVKEIIDDDDSFMEIKVDRPVVTKKIIIGTKILRYDSRYKKVEGDLVKPLFHKTKLDISEFETNLTPSDASTVITTTVDAKMKIPRIQEDDENLPGVITYKLSDPEYIEKGWTKLPTTKIMRKMNVYKMVPTKPDWFKQFKDKETLFYNTGERLAEVDEDGHGRWFYKNGSLALDYYKPTEANAQQRFIVYSSGEPDTCGQSAVFTILACFDFLGNGVVYDHLGNVRLKYNQSEGILIDKKIGPPGRWKWHTLNDPPVLQHVFVNTHTSDYDIRFLELLKKQKDDRSEASSKQTKGSDEQMLEIEYENILKEKAKKLLQKFRPFEIRMKAVKLNNYFSLKIMDQSNIYLLMRDGLTSLKLNLGMNLINDEIIDTETAEVYEVSTPYDCQPAKTESLSYIQNTLHKIRQSSKSDSGLKSDTSKSF